MSTLQNGRKISPAITTSTGSLYLIPLKVCNVRARTVTVCGACLALTNILNKVYSERSCLTCAHGNSRTVLAYTFKEGGSFQEKESTQKYRIESRKENGYLLTRIISVFKNERGRIFWRGRFFCGWGLWWCFWLLSLLRLV